MYATFLARLVNISSISLLVLSYVVILRLNVYVYFLTIFAKVLLILELCYIAGYQTWGTTVQREFPYLTPPNPHSYAGEGVTPLLPLARRSYSRRPGHCLSSPS